MASLWSFAVPASLASHGQIVALEGVVSGLPSLSGQKESGLRKDLLRLLEDADGLIVQAQKSLGEGKVKEAVDRYADASQKLREFVHTVSENTTRSGHTDKPISPADAATLINAALQIEKVTAVATSPAHGQIVDLEGFVYLAQDLAGANQDELRYDLADRLASADKAYLDGDQRLSQGGRRGANDKFTQAQLGLGKFIELVQKSTQDAQHPANPISPATATSWTATAQQIQAVIVALIH